MPRKNGVPNRFDLQRRLGFAQELLAIGLSLAQTLGGRFQLQVSRQLAMKRGESVNCGENRGMRGKNGAGSGREHSCLSFHRYRIVKDKEVPSQFLAS
jgi:hypothetical protein